jgi:60 kDa SS-A/Ro ribonucleoprotein
MVILLRDICEKAIVCSFSDDLVEVPARRGFALRDAVDASQPHSGTYLGKALGEIRKEQDRITGGQAQDRVSGPRGHGYVINIASAKNGVGYGPWTHIDGWSEAVVGCIRTFEQRAQTLTETGAADFAPRPFLFRATF